MAQSRVIPVDDVVVLARHRKDLGDLQGLADSIQAEGLLQAIGITQDRELVFGLRRLRAVKDILGWDRIDAKVVNVSSITTGECVENEVRKDFTLTERDAIRRTLEESVGNRQGKRTDLKTPKLPGKCPEVKPGEETRDFTSEKVGFASTDEARRVRTVVDKGIQPLQAVMDSGKVAPFIAAKLASGYSKSEQKPIVAAGASEIRKAARRVQRSAGKDIPDWAKGPTPKEQADNDPAYRWCKSLHKLYVYMTSTRDHGGIAQLAKKWPKKGKKEYVAELKRINGELTKWISILEKA